MLIPRRHFLTTLAAGSLFAPAAQAQFRVEIAGVGATQLPLALTRFRDEDRSGVALSAVVRADLERSGLFRIVESSGALDERSQPQWADWRGRGADSFGGCCGRGAASLVGNGFAAARTATGCGGSAFGGRAGSGRFCGGTCWGCGFSSSVSGRPAGWSASAFSFQAFSSVK